MKGFEIPKNFVGRYHDLVSMGLSDDECIAIIASDIEAYHQENERLFAKVEEARNRYLEAKFEEFKNEIQNRRFENEMREAKNNGQETKNNGQNKDAALEEALMLIRAVEDAEKAEVLRVVEMAERCPQPSAPPLPICEGLYAKCAL